MRTNEVVRGRSQKYESDCEVNSFFLCKLITYWRNWIAGGTTVGVKEGIRLTPDSLCAQRARSPSAPHLRRPD